MTQSANDFTKTAINENTVVRHISRNDYTYYYDAGDGRTYEKNGLNHDVYLTEESPIGSKSWNIGCATNKKEFVDMVYSDIH